MAFVNRVAEAAEAADHHPDIKISYNRVKMTLSTHSEGGVTEKDFDLAGRIDEAATATEAPRPTSQPDAAGPRTGRSYVEDPQQAPDSAAAVWIKRNFNLVGAGHRARAVHRCRASRRSRV